MEPPITLLVLPVALLAYVFYRYILHPAFLSPLSKIPSLHPTCSVSERYKQKLEAESKNLTEIEKAHRRHGPLVRIGPNEISVASEEGLRAIYTAGLERSDFYKTFRNYKALNLVSIPDGKSHAIQRKWTTSVYAKSYLWHSEDMATLSAVVAGRLSSLLRKYAVDNKDCDLALVAQWIGMDMMTGYQFGIDTGTNWLHDHKTAQAYLDEYNRERELHGHPKYAEDTCMKMCKLALSKMRGEKDAGRSKPVVFEKLFSPMHKAFSEQGKTEEEAITRTASEMLDEMLAGHETTSIAVTYVVWHISQQPDLQSRLREELRTLSPSLAALPEEDRDAELPSPADIDGLPFLHGVLTETLRLNAPRPAAQPRLSPPQGMTLHDKFIPGGIVVSSNAFTLHRDESVFPDAFSWQPDRWLERTTTGDKFGGTGQMKRYFWAFGSGGKMCIGNNFIVQVLKLAIAVIYANYTTVIVDDEGIEQEEVFISRSRGNKLVVKLKPVE